jgi:hypothetical protein
MLDDKSCPKLDVLLQTSCPVICWQKRGAADGGSNLTTDCKLICNRLHFVRREVYEGTRRKAFVLPPSTKLGRGEACPENTFHWSRFRTFAVLLIASRSRAGALRWASKRCPDMKPDEAGSEVRFYRLAACRARSSSRVRSGADSLCVGMLPGANGAN